MNALSRLAPSVLAAAAAMLLAGCIADSAEDTDLPWATNQPWEGITPVGPSILNRYD